MANKKLDKFGQLADFSSSDGEISSSPQSLKRLQDTVDEQLARAEKAGKKSWLSRAPAGRKEFEAKVSGLLDRLTEKFGSRDELLAAIKNGLLGGAAQKKLQLQFRNRSVDELSDDDLMSLVGDQEVLELLKREEEKKK
jgi:hypothetical protein